MSTSTRDDLENFSMPDFIDLSTLPAPKVIEELDFETIFQELLADFIKRKPHYNALLESDPAIMALEVSAYRELLLRNRINESAKANMLAYAEGEDLDNLAVLFGVKRMVIDRGDPEATPPTEPIHEDDDRLRIRVQLSLNSLSTAGSEKTYIYHTFSASPKVKSTGVFSEEKGQVNIIILSTEEDGTASSELIEKVEEYLNSEEIRPLTDKVIVESAEIIEYEVKAKVYIYHSPAVSVVEDESRNKLQQYLSKQHKIGGVVACSGIYNALHIEGVQKVDLIEPTGNITTTKRQAAFCNSVELEFIKVNTN